LTATSGHGRGTRRWFVIRLGLASVLGGYAKGVAEEIDGVALEAERTWA